MTTSVRTIEVPWGTMHAVARDGRLARLRFGDAERRGPEQAVICALRAQLAAYFDGARTGFDLPLWLDGTPFQQKVWAELRTVGHGETITYGELARRLGDANAARAVGAANGKNPLPLVVPCHRVVAANGKLGGYSGGGAAVKRFLLDHEAAAFELR